MNFFGELTKRPWLAEQGAIDNREEGSAYGLPSATVGLRLFLVVVTVLFSLLVVAYADRMYFPDWHDFREPWLLWLNTGMLVLSSIAMQWARNNARKGRGDRVTTGLIAGGAYALAFIAGQVLVWYYLVAEGYFASENPAISFFYLITALHGLHLLGGLVVLARTTAKVWNGFDAAKAGMSVALCTVYWHYLLVVWLILFGLLLFT